MKSIKIELFSDEKFKNKVYEKKIILPGEIWVTQKVFNKYGRDKLIEINESGPDTIIHIL